MRRLSDGTIHTWLVTDSLLAVIAVMGVIGWVVTAAVRFGPKSQAVEVSRISEEVSDQVEFTEEGDHWRFVVMDRSTDTGLLPAELRVFRNEELVYGQLGKTEGWLVGMEVDQMSLPDGRVLVCTLEFPGAGHPYARHFFSVRNHQLVRAANVGGENGGPEFRDYDGDAKAEWVFDNFNWYEHYGNGPDRFQLFKETKSGKLRLWKSLPNPKRRHLKDAFEFHNL